MGSLASDFCAMNHERRYAFSVHSRASFTLPNTSTPGAAYRPTLSSARLTPPSGCTPATQTPTARAASTRCTRMSASAALMSTPGTSARSSTRKRSGCRAHAAGATSARIVSSTFAIVPKKRKPGRRGQRLSATREAD
jgi:hypothetical protein